MSLEEKHRTLLLADDFETSRAILGACRFQHPGTGEEFVIPGRKCDDEGATTGSRITGPVGRFDEMRVWDGKGDPSRRRAVEAMIFPNLGKTDRFVTWDGQNFAAFCTQWENQHSPLVAMSPHPEPTVVVDAFNQVIGYYLKKVSSKYLFATDDGAIFYMSYLLSDPTYSVNTKSIAGDKIFITPADEPVYTTGKIGGYKAWMKIEKWADLLVDIDGFVAVIHTYGDSDKSVAKKYNTAVDGVPLLGWLAPRLPNPNIPDKCFGEFDEDMIGYEECADKMISFHVDSMMLLMDALTLGGSKVARKLLDVARKTVLRTTQSTAVALTLHLRARAIQIGGNVHDSPNRWFARSLPKDGRLHMSRGPVSQEGLIRTIDRNRRKGRKQVVLSGTHGSPPGDPRPGRLDWKESPPGSPEPDGRDFLREDIKVIGGNGHSGIQVLDITKMSEKELKTVLNAGHDVYAGFCESACSVAIKRAFESVTP